MFRRLTAPALALALALVPAEAPAQMAERDDLARLFLGLLAAGAIAKAIEDSRDDDDDDRNVTVNRYYPAPTYHPPHPPRTVIPAPPPLDHRPYAHVQRPGSRALPAVCARKVTTQFGPRTFVGRGCLESYGVNTAALPRSCQRELDYGRRDANAWNARCLADAGWRLGG